MRISKRLSGRGVRLVLVRFSSYRPVESEWRVEFEITEKENNKLGKKAEVPDKIQRNSFYTAFMTAVRSMLLIYCNVVGFVFVCDRVCTTYYA